MKSLKIYINEKLKINSKSKVNTKDNSIPELTDNYVVNKILYVWGLGTEEYDAIEAIQSWVDKNKIDDVKPAADLETLNDAKDYGMTKEIRDLYDDSYKMNEECQWRLGSAKVIYTFEEEHAEIFAAPDVIAFCGEYGTLYCLPINTL